MTPFVQPIIDGGRNFDGAGPWRVVAASRAARMAGFIPPPLDGPGAETRAEPAAAARVNHNRLIADCPDCGGAEFVWRDGPHAMVCLSCLNGALGGRWRRVVMPADYPAIEAALLARPLPQTRNWSETETVADLLTQNAAEGV